MTFEIVRQTLRAEADAVPKDWRNGRKVQSKRHNHHHHFDREQVQREEWTQLQEKTLTTKDNSSGKKLDSKKIFFLLTPSNKFYTIMLDKKMLINSAFRRRNALKIKKFKKTSSSLDKGSLIVL
jgi:hypothetical protein